MTEAEKSSPEFINQVKEMLNARLETRAGGASGVDLIESIKAVSGKEKAARAMGASPILGGVIQGDLPLDAVNFGDLMKQPTASASRPIDQFVTEAINWDKDGNPIGWVNTSLLTGRKTTTGSTTTNTDKLRAKVQDAEAPYSNNRGEVQVAIADFNDQLVTLEAAFDPSATVIEKITAKRDAAQVRLNALTAIEGISSPTVKEKWNRFMASYAHIMENLMTNGSADQKKDIMNLPIMIKDGGANTADALISEMKTLLD